MKKKVAVLPGDGIGPEVIASAVSVIQTVTDKVEFLNGDVGMTSRKDNGEYLPRKTIDMIDESDAVLFGTVTDAYDDPAYRSPLLVMAKQLDLSINVKRFYRLSKDIGIRDLDCFLVSENKEASAMTEIEDLDGVTSQRHTSTVGCKKLCTMARHFAETNNKKNIMLAHDGDHLRASKRILIKEFTEAMKGSPMNSQTSSYIDIVRRL
ncbi:MAG: isocitrate/isopropylmalate family dehydrogenase, partial [Methanomassiliicoccaceae archaeon]|nr:isocitrate/isopropylmalate family dehydrogenase [Methanomassiliicoccaceae archaeon]